MVSERAPSGPVLDLENALARLGGDRELFADMVGFLFDDLPKLRDELGNAIARRDAKAVRMHAHALRGLVAGCGGMRATSAAQAVEDAGHSGDLSHIGSYSKDLDAELDLLEKALAEYKP